MKNDESSIHAGHRARLAEIVNRVGLKGLTEVQQIEWILTYIFPRGDVNPLAHRLLKKYQCYANMVDASVQDLCDVPGMNIRSAIKFKNMKEISGLYHLSKIKNGINIKDIGKLLDFLEDLLKNEIVENMYFFAINQKGVISQYRQINMDDVRAVGITPEIVCNFINSSRLSELIIVHNHPYDTAVASDDDILGLEKVQGYLAAYNCELYDSLIVGEDGIYSCLQQGFARTNDNCLI